MFLLSEEKINKKSVCFTLTESQCSFYASYAARCCIYTNVYYFTLISNPFYTNSSHKRLNVLFVH